VSIMRKHPLQNQIARGFLLQASRLAFIAGDA
jgi:hypothetical protein